MFKTDNNVYQKKLGVPKKKTDNTRQKIGIEI